MGTITCKEFLDDLEPWMEGERASDAEAHLRTCSRCRGVVEDLNAIGDAGRAWAATEPEPPSHLWPLLRARLEQEGLIRERRPGWSERMARWFGFIPRPALASAFLALLIVLTLVVGLPNGRRDTREQWLEGTRVSTAPLGQHLTAAEESTISTFRNPNPEATASLHKNLAIVDNYIALCEKSVREEPDNELARDYLYDAYHQKADLIAQINDRAENAP